MEVNDETEEDAHKDRIDRAKIRSSADWLRGFTYDVILIRFLPPTTTRTTRRESRREASSFSFEHAL